MGLTGKNDWQTSPRLLGSILEPVREVIAQKVSTHPKSSRFTARGSGWQVLTFTSPPNEALPCRAVRENGIFTPQIGI